MNHNKLKMGALASIFCVLAISSSAEAISLIGNYSSTNDGTNSVINAGTSQKAVGFTLPTGSDYSLNKITLRLAGYNTSGGDVALLQIYADPSKTSNDPNGANLQSVLFNNPSSSSDVASGVVFIPTSTFTFTADTRYWLLATATAGSYSWNANSPSITPTGISGIITNGYLFSTDNGSSYASSSVFNSFNIDVTPVPFEFNPAFGLLALGGLWLGRRLVKKKSPTV